MHYWRIRLDHGKNDVVDVYYSSAVDWSLGNVPKYAMRDGHLHSSFVRRIDSVVKITAEEYHKHME